jgi:S-DNA-T family DNA segregation ATPase FtsK/SpoIIIE
MNPLAGAYAQRILLTVFLASFGIYLLIATVTYTPFDPGWTHVSSDTQRVTNASGVAGAWIADLLWGFFGHAAVLLPFFIIAEAIQLWWPQSFLNRPFRFAAEFFLLVIVAALFSLHLLEPADTMSNASGGIIGFEIGKNLLSLVGMILSTIFLVVLFLLMFTFVFGIQWHKTMDTIGKIPFLLQELFYRNVPERETATDFTLGSSPINTAVATARATTVSQTEIVENQPHDSVPEQGGATEPDTIQEAVHSAAPDAVPSNTAAETVIQSGQRWSAHPAIDRVLNATQPDDILAGTDHLASSDAARNSSTEKSHPTEKNEQTTAAQKIEPRFDWDDQSLFDELLNVVPKQAVAPAATIEPAQQQPISAPHCVAPQQPQVSHQVNQPSNQVSNPFESDTSRDVVDSMPTILDYPHSPVATEFDAIEADFDHNIDVDVLDQEERGGLNNPAPEPALSDEFNEQDWLDNSSFSANSVPAITPSAAMNTAYADSKHDSTADFAAGFVDDFDAPLTDATGRPMSRAMQVVEKRALLSPLPSLDLLELPDPNRKVSYTAEQLERLSKLLEIKLQEFNVKANVVEAQPGPVVTRFELELAPGVKASKVTNISRDLARSMSMASVRVVEVIPGKPYIGIEVPNSTREMVRLIELLETPMYRDPSGLITMAMGKDIAGKPVLTDLSKAPHMLVAGTTGSGKSVAVNAMLLSILLKYTPQQIRLILIDPKQLELASYSDIPHLLTPVVTDMKDAVSALNWAVNEMERRYKLMTFLKVRKIDEFNRKVVEAIERGEDLLDPTWKPNDSAVQDRAPRLQSLPSIVIVADEFADMIMQVGKKAEELITRLAQKSRAAGIHLMLATQRPSVDVITGLIKANIPTRVALRVNSKIDSRTILDGGGAEDLLGHGDMLFLAPGKIEPERVHGAFISDDEVNRITDAWRERGSPDYVDDILTPYDEEPSSRGFDSEGGGDPERDAMYDQAVQFVLETRKCSASALQRKFSLGYNRAARLIDNMEDAGIISPMGPSGKRDILV